MKKLILLLSFIALSCSKDNSSECIEIEQQYIKALQYAGGSQAAVNQVKSQYEQKKKNAGCN